MNRSRQQILEAIRKVEVPELALPVPGRNGTVYPDATAQFSEMVEAVGATCIQVPNLSEAARHLPSLPFWDKAGRIVSRVAEAHPGNVDLDKVEDARDLNDVDVAILPGEFGVAENAAIWVTGKHVRHRAIYFIPEHLVLVVPAGEIVHNMHEAYARLSFDSPGFGVFISGPSKTADIEQSLVMGAQGPRSLTVFLAGPSNGD